MATRRSRRSSIDIWPGFVDALAQLLMVIIFMLLVFTAGPVFAVGRAVRPRQGACGTAAAGQRTERSAGARAQQRRGVAGGRGDAVDAAEGHHGGTRHVATRLAELAAQADQETARADEVTGKLRDAEATVSADKEKIELQLSEIESLRRDIEALKAVRADLEKQVRRPRRGSSRKRRAARPLEGARGEAGLRAGADGAGAKGDQRPRHPACDALAPSRATQAAHQVEQLSAQIAALREQLAKIAAALDAFGSQGQGAADADRRSRQAAQPGARQQGAGAGALPLRILRQAARDHRRPAGHPHRRRPLRVSVGGAVRAGQRRARRGRQAAARPGDRRAEGDLRQDPEGAQLGACGSTAIPTSGRSATRNSPRTGSCRRRARSRSCAT